MAKGKKNKTNAGGSESQKWDKLKEMQLANIEQNMAKQGFTERTFLPSGQIMWKKPDQVSQSFDKMVGGGFSSGITPSLSNLDKQLSYQGIQYGELPSYKIGQQGGSVALDKLAAMMGGQIYNPYQFARMTSAGGASGEYPYKSAITAQAAGQEMGLQGLRGRQAESLQRQGSQQDLEKLALASGFSSVADMQSYARRKQSGLLSR